MKCNQLCSHLHEWIKANEFWCRVWRNGLRVNMPRRKGLGESTQRSGMVPQGRKGNQKDVVKQMTTKTCLSRESPGDNCMCVCVWTAFVLVCLLTVQVCSRVSVLQSLPCNLNSYCSHPAFSVSQHPLFTCLCDCAAGTPCVGVHVWHRAVPLYASSPVWFFSGTRLGHVCTC